MKKKRGRTSNSSHHRTSWGRGRTLLSRHHQHSHQHSRFILWILLTLTFIVFVIAILVTLEIPPFYLGLSLAAFFLVILLELGFYLKQEHKFHHFRRLPKRQSIIQRIKLRTYHPKKYTFHTPKGHMPKLHLPQLDSRTYFKRISTAFGHWKFQIHIPKFKLKHHPKPAKKISSHELLSHFFSLGRHGASKRHKNEINGSSNTKPLKKEEAVEEKHFIPKNVSIGTYETQIDAVYKAVKEKGKISIDEIAKQWKVRQELVQEWAKILEEHKLVQIHYPALGSPELRMYEEKKSSEEQKSEASS